MRAQSSLTIDSMHPFHPRGALDAIVISKDKDIVVCSDDAPMGSGHSPLTAGKLRGKKYPLRSENTRWYWSCDVELTSGICYYVLSHGVDHEC
jgi:hypothetical protein